MSSAIRCLDAAPVGMPLVVRRNIGRDDASGERRTVPQRSAPSSRPATPSDVLGLELFGRELYPELILALAALLTAVAGVLSAWAALRRTKTNTQKTAEQECLERIKAAYQETEQMAQALHNLRTKGILE